MNSDFKKEMKTLRLCYHLFDPASEEKKLKTLQRISRIQIPLNKDLSEYQNLLLFISAHPSQKKIDALVLSEMNRITKKLKGSSQKSLEKLIGSGLPFTTTKASFTHDLLCILQEEKNFKLSYSSSDEENIELNHLLSFTLPEIEKDHTSAGMTQEDLFDTLQIHKTQKLELIIEELKKLNHVPFIKDFLLDKFNLFIDLYPKNATVSKWFNHLQVADKFHHSEILKKFDHLHLIQTPLPESKKLSEQELKRLIQVMQTALVLLERETDPCTFIDPKSLRYFELERGISVAIFGMIPERQMSVESYVGYTLFKNGYPCAYGGAWIYGNRALFGINIFEQFRGGESGYVLMQLLRTYKQAFGLNYFEVEPYQYGLDNPEGIESGAFWFYYRYGFQPLDKSLQKLAQTESEKIKTKKGYRSNSKTLIRFTESNIGWKLEADKSKPITDVRSKVTQFIAKKHRGNRENAIQDSLNKLATKINISHYTDNHKRKTLTDFALITEALQIKKENIIQLIPVLVSKKADDLYSYNKALQIFQNEINAILK